MFSVVYAGCGSPGVASMVDFCLRWGCHDRDRPEMLQVRPLSKITSRGVLNNPPGGEWQ